MHLYYVYCVNEIVRNNGDGTLKCPKCDMQQPPAMVEEIKVKVTDMVKHAKAMVEQPPPGTLGFATAAIGVVGSPVGFAAAAIGAAGSGLDAGVLA